MSVHVFPKNKVKRKPKKPLMRRILAHRESRMKSEIIRDQKTIIILLKMTTSRSFSQKFPRNFFNLQKIS